MHSGGVSVRLDGALSRNPRLRELRPGDVLQAKILQRIDAKSALLDVRGNIIHATFTGPVPELSSVTLVLKNASAGSLQFEMRRGASVPDSPLAALFGAALSKELEKSRALPRAFKAGEKTLFGVLRFLAGSSAERSKHFRSAADMLRHAGFSTSLPGISSLLSGLSERESSLVSLLFAGIGKKSERTSDAEHVDAKSAAEALAFAAEAAHPRHAFVAFDADGGPLLAECLRGDSFFACSFELPALGLVEAVFRGDGLDSCDVLLAADGEGFDALSAELSVLADSLLLISGGNAVELVRRASLCEKILALSERLTDNTFDVTA